LCEVKAWRPAQPDLKDFTGPAQELAAQSKGEPRNGHAGVATAGIAVAVTVPAAQRRL